MEDSNPQETIADLHVGFLDRCANHYTNLPYLPGTRNRAGSIWDSNPGHYSSSQLSYIGIYQSAAGERA